MSAINVEDEYDEYNYDQDKLVNSGHSGNIINYYEPNDIIDVADLTTFLLGSILLTWFFLFVTLQVRIEARKRPANTPITSIRADTRGNSRLNCKTPKPTGRKRI